METLKRMDLAKGEREVSKSGMPRTSSMNAPRVSAIMAFVIIFYLLLLCALRFDFL